MLSSTKDYHVAAVMLALDSKRVLVYVCFAPGRKGLEYLAVGLDERGSGRSPGLACSSPAWICSMSTGMRWPKP
jgi:hypothetical protein